MTFIQKLKEQLTKISPWPWSCDYTPNGIHAAKCYSESIKSGYEKDENGKFNELTKIVDRPRTYNKEQELESLQDGRFIAKSPENIHKLIELVEEAVKVIDFYGDPLTYVSNSGKVGITPIYTNDCENIKGTTGAFRYCGGKRAREFLKKIEELK